MSSPSLLADIELSRDNLLAAARRYLGLPYSLRAGYVCEVDGVLTGSVNCISYVLYVARDLGLLPSDFHPRGYYREYGLSLDDFCARVLVEECSAVDPVDAAPADLLLFSLPESERKHIAIKSGLDPLPHGTILHAVNFNGIHGAVVENGLDSIDWARLEGVYRLRQVTA